MSTEVPGSPQEPTPVAPPPAPAPAPEAPAGSPSKDEKTWAMLAHLGAILFYFVAPLVVMLVQKDKLPFAEQQAKESLNFQITVAIAWVAAGALSAIGIGFLLFPVIGIGNLVFCIMAGMKANEGIAYEYPVALRLIK